MIPVCRWEGCDGTIRPYTIHEKSWKNSIIKVDNNVPNIIHYYDCSIFITSYFFTYSGSFNIPVTCLLSPDKEYMVREADEKFIECLKHEMLKNRTCDVAPIVATVRLSDDEQFDMKHPEA